MEKKDSKELAPPQELPDLAMDMYPMEISNVKMEDEHKFEGQPEEQKEEKPAAEMKPLNIEGIKPEEETIEEKKTVPQPAEPEAKINAEIVQEKPVWDDPQDSKTEEVKHPSFFSEIKELFSKKQGSHNIQASKIIEKMKDFHKNAEVSQQSLIEKAKFDTQITDKIMELELLEKGWYFLRKEIEIKNTLLNDKEALIDIKIKELKKLMAKSREQGISPSQQNLFILKNGRKISTIDDLKTELKTMADDVFSHHTSQGKNDFFNWIKNALNNPGLADKIFSANSKDAMLKILEEN